jgi:hypothetical protein
VAKVVQRDLSEVTLRTSSGTWILNSVIVQFLKVLWSEDRVYKPVIALAFKVY